MDIRIIVFGMCFVLIALFIGANYFVPKEKDRSNKEAQFALSMKDFLQAPSQEKYDQCLAAAQELPHLKNKDERTIKSYLEKNGISL